MSEVKNRVAVTGMGVVSPVGNGTQECWDQLLKGKKGVSKVSSYDKIGLPVTCGGVVPVEGSTSYEKHINMASGAMDEALNQAGLPGVKTGFSWSCGLDMFEAGAQGWQVYRAGEIFLELSGKFSGPATMIATACASGAQSIGEAFQWIRAGKLSACMAGGSSMILSPFYLIGFSSLRAIAGDSAEFLPEESCRPFDKSRGGFALSDGAGALVLESFDHAQQRGAKILAEVTGYGVSQDAFDLHRPPESGEGAALCIRRALKDAGLAPSEIHAVNAHATGTISGDIAEAAAVRQVFKDEWQKLPVYAVKGSTGHCMSAAGAIEAAVSILTCSTGLIPFTVNLQSPAPECELNHVTGAGQKADVKNIISLSFGMGGQNAALVFTRYGG